MKVSSVTPIQRRRRAPALVTALALLLALLTLTTPRAQAVAIAGVITNATTTCNPNNTYGQCTVALPWSIPASANAGDTFTVTLPNQLGGWASPITLYAPNGTTVVGTGTISAGPPSVVTVTLTSAVDQLNNVSGTLTMTANLRDPVAAAGTTQTFTTTSGGSTWSSTTTFAAFSGNPNARKWSAFADANDQCRNTGTACLTWGIVTDVGPIAGDITITDTVPAGQSIVCPPTKPVGSYLQDTLANYQGSNPTANYAVVSCTSTKLVVVVHGVPANQQVVVYFSASVTASIVGGVTYTNSATVAEPGVTKTVNSTITSNSSSGSGSGTGISVYKKDAAGNDANTSATAVTLTGSSTNLVFTMTNIGSVGITAVNVTDTITNGSGAVTGLACNFSQAATGAPTTGTTWAGPWPAGKTFTCTATLSGVTGTMSSDVVKVTGTAGTATLTSYDAYNALRGAVSVGNLVWYDANANGLQDTGEQGIPGATVTLTGPTGAAVTNIYGTTVAAQTTDVNGLYSFSDLPILTGGQTYTVTVTTPTGYNRTTALVGSDRSKDSSSGSASSTGLTTAGSSDTTLDFGFVRTGISVNKQLTDPDTGARVEGPVTIASPKAITYWYTLTNSGSESLTTVTLSDDKCAGATRISGDTNSNNRLDGGESWLYSCTSTIAATTTNTATASGVGVASGATVTSTDTATVTYAPVPSINLVKTAGTVSAPNATGDATISYTITATNTGFADGSYGPVLDSPAFAANLAISSLTWTGPGSATPTTVTPSAGTYQLGSAHALAAGASETYTVVVTLHFTNTTAATACAGSGTGLFNAVSAAGEQGPTTDNTACAAPPAPPTTGLTLSKAAAVTDVNGDGYTGVGDTIRYTFTVRNTGSVTLAPVTIDDPLLGFTSWSCAASLAAGAQTTCSAPAGYAVSGGDATAGLVHNTATATGNPAYLSPVTSPQAVADTPVARSGSAVVTKSDAASGATLPGAVFALYQSTASTWSGATMTPPASACDAVTGTGSPIRTGLTTGADGTVTVSPLRLSNYDYTSYSATPPGGSYTVYCLVETRAAVGHNLLAQPIAFVVSSPTTPTAVAARDTAVNLGNLLPMSGGSGAGGLAVAALLVVAAALAWEWRRRSSATMEA